VWEDNLPPIEDDLRQGDLLAGVPIVRLDRRFEPDQQGASSVRVKLKTVIVVTQCCTVEQQQVVSVSPVASTRRMVEEDQMYKALLTEEPPPPEAVNDVPYVNNLFRLDAFGQHIQPQAGRLKVAELSNVQTFTGDTHWLRKARVARMTPRARQLLRFKLAVLWGRVEPTDADALKAMGFEDR
jgi:hypothetical protein